MSLIKSYLSKQQFWTPEVLRKKKNLQVAEESFAGRRKEAAETQKAEFRGRNVSQLTRADVVMQ